MMVNRYRPHVWLIPEDDADRQLAVGFLNHEAVADAVVGVRAPAGGWHEVLDVFESEYLPQLRRYQGAHVVMLIDFDGDESRRAHFEGRIADDVKPRVFVVGSKDDPETLRRELGMSLEKIGRELAQDCLADELRLWLHPHLVHNGAELRRMTRVIKPILFP